jgi:Glycosyl hydrolase family 1
MTGLSCLSVEIDPAPRPTGLREESAVSAMDTVDSSTSYPAKGAHRPAVSGPRHPQMRVVRAVPGDRVTQWATPNEPRCAAWIGHLEGRHAPGISDISAAVPVPYHLLLGHRLAAGDSRAPLRCGGVPLAGTSPSRYWTTWNGRTATGPVRTDLGRLRNPAAGTQGQRRSLRGHYQDTARSFGRRPGRGPRVVIADGRTCVRRPTPASSRWTCPLWLSRSGGAGHRCCRRVAPLRKSSIGSVAAPSATASGPS